MTPDALRAAIASARLRPRMHGETPMHVAAYLLGMIHGARPDGDGGKVHAAWCEAYACATPRGMTDDEACDAAEATVAALWPQGDAPAADECAAFSPAPLDTPMPPAFVEALAALSPAQPAALDLAAIEARARKRVLPCEWAPTRNAPASEFCGAPCVYRCNNGGDCGISRCANHAESFSGGCDHEWYPLDNGAEDTLALLAKVRELEAEAADMREGVAYAGASCDREVQVHGVWLRASRLGPPSGVARYAEVAAERDEARAEAERLRAEVAAAQPAVDLVALRNGRFTLVPVADDNDAAQLAALAGEERWSPFVKLGVADGAVAAHVSTDGAAWQPLAGWRADAAAAGGAFAERHPYAAAGIMGACVAPKGET